MASSSSSSSSSGGGGSGSSSSRPRRASKRRQEQQPVAQREELAAAVGPDREVEGWNVRAYLVCLPELLRLLTCGNRLVSKALCKDFADRCDGDKDATKWWVNQRKWVRLLLSCSDEQLMTMAESGRTVELAYSLECLVLYLAERSVRERQARPAAFVLPTDRMGRLTEALGRAVDARFDEKGFPQPFRLAQMFSSQHLPAALPRCFAPHVFGALSCAALADAAEQNRRVSEELRALEAERDAKRKHKRRKKEDKLRRETPWAAANRAEGDPLSAKAPVRAVFHQIRQWLFCYESLCATAAAGTQRKDEEEANYMLFTFRI